MTEEEYFRKTYPDSCYGDRLLSPHWDFFQAGVEFGERQSEKKIATLEKENENLKKTYRKQRNKRIDELQKENAELRSGCGMCYRKDKEQLTKAKEIIKDLLGSENTSCEEEMFFEIRQKAEQFLSEVEK